MKYSLPLQAGDSLRCCCSAIDCYLLRTGLGIDNVIGMILEIARFNHRPLSSGT
jgi:hypothetical protein